MLSSLLAATKREVCARLKNMHHLAQNQPLVLPPGSRLVRRSMRDNFRPLLLVEPNHMRIPGLGLPKVDQALESKHG
jgi:hypothetical protein